MKEVLKTIISNLVDNEEAVEINQIDSEKSIRTVMKAVAAREHKKVSVEFIG